MAEKKIKVGIVGIGRAGWGMHARELERFPELFSVVAAIDTDASRVEKMKERFKGCKPYADYKKFLADKNIELVAVANRSPEHTSYAIAALEAGKYVFIEKPIALTYADGKKLLAASKKFPGKLFCRHNRRLEPQFQLLKDIMKSGKLGEVYEIKHCVHGYQRRDDWQTIIDCGGGQLNNWGPHLIDHGVQLLESPVAEIWSNLKLVTALGDAEDHVKIILKGENGRLFDMEISGGVTIGDPMYTVYGTRGSAKMINGNTFHLKYLDPKQTVFAKYVADRESPPIENNFANPEVLNFVEEDVAFTDDQYPNINDIYKFVFASIRKKAVFPVKIEEALEVVRVTETVKKQNPAFLPKSARMDEVEAKGRKLEAAAKKYFAAEAKKAAAKKPAAKAAPAKKAPCKKAAAKAAPAKKAAAKAPCKKACKKK